MIKGTLSPRMFWASVQLSVIFTGGSSDTFQPWTWDVSCSNKDENDKEEKREEDLCGGMSQRAQGVIILLYALILRGQDGEEGAKGWMKRDEWKEPKNEGSWGREWKVGNEGMKKRGVNTDIITQSQFTCSSQLLRFHSFSLCSDVPPRPTSSHHVLLVLPLAVWPHVCSFQLTANKWERCARVLQQAVKSTYYWLLIQ